MELCVIGVGYVGLVTGAVFADMGNEVACVDVDEEKVRQLNEGRVPIYEPGLEEMIHRNMKDGRLRFITCLKDGVQPAEVIFICVGTPPKNNGETDLSQVEAAARGIARHINGYKVIVNKSTVPVGTGDLVREAIERHRSMTTEFDVVSNPEFLREGSAVQDALAPDRIVVGAPNKKVAMRLLELYASLGRPMIITDVRSAEMIKYASNAFLATKISFINAVANVCDAAGANVLDVAKGMGLDPRIGSAFLQAGLGFGGSCFPKDIESLVHTSARYGYDFELLRAVIRINRDRPCRFVALIRKRLSPLKGRKIGVLGLAFKPDTDDMREARSIEIVAELVREGTEVKAYDPAAMENARRVLPPIQYCQSPYEAAEEVDGLAILTEWREFRLLNLERIKSVMRQPILFDGRNIYDAERKRKLGFEYYGFGRSG